jgi:hypothetical protein
VEVEEDLARFGYSTLWLDYGLIDRAFLHAQVDQQRATGDPHGEHYRYAAFVRWLRHRQSATDDELLRFTELAQADPDPAMGRSALIELVQTAWLTAAQRALVSERLAGADPVIQNIIRRVALLHLLEGGALDEDLFQRCLDEGDRVVHVALLDHPALTRDQVNALSRRGATRAIRRRATQRSQSRRWQP